MSPADKEQVWATAYAIAFAVTTMGAEILGNKKKPEEIDARAKALADQASSTIIQRVEAAERLEKGKK